MKTVKKYRKQMTAVLTASVLALASGCGTTAMAAPDASDGGTAISESEADDMERSGDDGSAAAATLTADQINIKESDYWSDWTSESYTEITLSGTGGSVDGAGAAVQNGTVTISREGNYVLSGSFDGQIVVNADEDAKVRIILNGVSVTADGTPAVTVMSADKVTISTAEGTENVLTDDSTRTEEELDAAIYSKEDLVLNGLGTLAINGQFKDAVHSKDDLRITGGSYVVTAADDGFVGKDRLEITDGDFTVKSGGDAFKSTNDEDEGKGFIYVAGGSYDITSGDEAFQSARELLVTDGIVEISAEGKGFHADTTLEITGGTLIVSKCYEGLEAPEILIRGGKISITASDDGINAAGGALETGTDSGQTGEIDWGSGADRESESGTGDGAMNRHFGGGMMSTSSGYLTISGGEIYINAAGDGIDSNTDITQTGGSVYVDGPTADMDGALDYDGTYEMTGGTLIAVGSSGMLQTISDSSTVNCLTVIFSSTQAAGSTVSVADADGNELLSYAPSKQYAALVFASADLTEGTTYTISSNGQKTGELTLSGTVTIVNESGTATSGGTGMGGFGHGGMGGRSGFGRGAGNTEGAVGSDDEEKMPMPQESSGRI